LDVALNAPVMEWSDSSYTVTAPAGTVVTQTLTISNTGTSDLYVSIGNYDGSIEPPPAVTPARTPGYRIDSRILSHMEIDGTADFIVVMAEQADLSGAYGISDWSARGHYVYDRLLQTAERTQAAIRGQLDSAGISYRPFLANNSIMVYDGDMALVNQLA